MLVVEWVLIAVAFGFAVSMGAHYTGACMGMPRAAGAIRTVPALLLMAPLVLVGALLASHGVVATVGHSILQTPAVALGAAVAIVGAALVLTSAYNFWTLPTSTIQILVFSAVGAGFADGIAIDWGTIGDLVVLWAVAPFAACGLAAAFVRVSDRWKPPRPNGLGRPAVAGLVAVGMAASFAMGANDVANASGALVMTGAFSVLAAVAIGGLGLALGVLTWGRPLLEKVAFRVIPLDARTATASQLAQSIVILVSVAFGLFTSMNQALVGAMIGAGLARRGTVVLGKAVRDILLGWALGPTSGLALGFVFAVAAAKLVPGG
ncbi:MAG: inorganic phosphate transporter family protein [Thermoplasmata archaeon]|jgi:PiT family inorganic phosphate transporter|nr:inorganic phosphate transporter family protein [Thermoplasmata archaeon]